MLFLTFLFLFQGLKTGTASDYAIPMTFQIKGKVVSGLDQPVATMVTITEASGATQSVETFSNGTFRFNNVVLGIYRVTVVDPRFDLYDAELLLREPGDTARELTVRLVKHGESPAPPSLDPSLYTIDAQTAAATPPKALEEFNKGVSALRNPSRSDPADAHFKRAIAGAPKFYEAYLQLGLEQHRQKKDSDAIQSLEKAAEIRPEEARPLSMLGDLYLASQKFEPAVSTMQKLDKIGKMEPHDHYTLGTSFYRLNRFDEAEEQLLIAINSGNDTDPSPFLQLHNVFIKKSQPARALLVLEDYLKLFPDDVNHTAMEERAREMRAHLRVAPKP